MKKLLSKLPIPISGLMLSLAALGNLVLSYGSVYRSIFGIISSIILILLIIKFLSQPGCIKEGLSNPVVASVMPTFSMGIMILAAYLNPYAQSAALGMWYTGLGIHIVLILYFTQKYILKFDIKKVFPSYFVVYVGIAAASVTAPAFNLSQIGQYAFWFGFITYLLLIPMIIYRCFAVKGIPEAALPTITIFAAPASLCLVGYLNSFKDKNMAIVCFLGFLSIIMFTCVLIYLPRLLKLRFYPSYSAFTFPIVISGMAMKLLNGFLNKSGKGIPSLAYIVKFQELLAVIIVVYVLVRYIGFLFEGNKSSSIKA